MEEKRNPIIYLHSALSVAVHIISEQWTAPEEFRLRVLPSGTIASYTATFASRTGRNLMRNLKSADAALADAIQELRTTAGGVGGGAGADQQPQQQQQQGDGQENDSSSSATSVKGSTSAKDDTSASNAVELVVPEAIATTTTTTIITTVLSMKNIDDISTLEAEAVKDDDDNAAISFTTTQARSQQHHHQQQQQLGTQWKSVTPMHDTNRTELDDAVDADGIEVTLAATSAMIPMNIPDESNNNNNNDSSASSNEQEFEHNSIMKSHVKSEEGIFNTSSTSTKITPATQPSNLENDECNNDIVTAAALGIESATNLPTSQSQSRVPSTTSTSTTTTTNTNPKKVRSALEGFLRTGKLPSATQIRKLSLRVEGSGGSFQIDPEVAALRKRKREEEERLRVEVTAAAIAQERAARTAALFMEDDDGGGGGSSSSSGHQQGFTSSTTTKSFQSTDTINSSSSSSSSAITITANTTLPQVKRDPYFLRQWPASCRSRTTTCRMPSPATAIEGKYICLWLPESAPIPSVMAPTEQQHATQNYAMEMALWLGKHLHLAVLVVTNSSNNNASPSSSLVSTSILSSALQKLSSDQTCPGVAVYSINASSAADISDALVTLLANAATSSRTDNVTHDNTTSSLSSSASSSASCCSSLWCAHALVVDENMSPLHLSILEDVLSRTKSEPMRTNSSNNHSSSSSSSNNGMNISSTNSPSRTQYEIGLAQSKSPNHHQQQQSQHKTFPVWSIDSRHPVPLRQLRRALQEELALIPPLAALQNTTLNTQVCTTFPVVATTTTMMVGGGGGSSTMDTNPTVLQRILDLARLEHADVVNILLQMHTYTLCNKTNAIFEAFVRVFFARWRELSVASSVTSDTERRTGISATSSSSTTTMATTPQTSHLSSFSSTSSSLFSSTSTPMSSAVTIPLTMQLSALDVATNQAEREQLAELQAVLRNRIIACQNTENGRQYQGWSLTELDVLPTVLPHTDGNDNTTTHNSTHTSSMPSMFQILSTFTKLSIFDDDKDTKTTTTSPVAVEVSNTTASLSSSSAATVYVLELLLREYSQLQLFIAYSTARKDEQTRLLTSMSNSSSSVGSSNNNGSTPASFPCVDTEWFDLMSAAKSLILNNSLPSKDSTTSTIITLCHDIKAPSLPHLVSPQSLSLPPSYEQLANGETDDVLWNAVYRYLVEGENDDGVADNKCLFSASISSANSSSIIRGKLSKGVCLQYFSRKLREWCEQTRLLMMKKNDAVETLTIKEEGDDDDDNNKNENHDNHIDIVHLAVQLAFELLGITTSDRWRNVCTISNKDSQSKSTSHFLRQQPHHNPAHDSEKQSGLEIEEKQDMSASPSSSKRHKTIAGTEEHQKEHQNEATRSPVCLPPSPPPRVKFILLDRMTKQGGTQTQSPHQTLLLTPLTDIDIAWEIILGAMSYEC